RCYDINVQLDVGQVISQDDFYVVRSIEKMFFTLVDISQLIFNYNYGLPLMDFKGNYSHTKHFVAVPYNAVKDPAKGSYFSDIDITIITTILSYFYNNQLRDIDVISIIENF